MRPDAASFSPFSGTTTSFDSTRAVMQYQQTSEDPSTVSDNGTAMSTKDTLRNMIVHTTIECIVSKVADLEARCIGLEEVNKKLHSKIALLEADREVNGGHHPVEGIQNAVNGAPHSASVNLTGYESPSNGSESNNSASPQPARQSSGEMREMWDEMEKFTKLLNEYEKRTAEQSVRTYDLSQRFERKDKASTWLQGRIGKLENGLKELDDKVDEIEANSHRGRSLNKGEGSAEVGAWLVDQVQQTQMRMANLEDTCSALSAVVENGPTEPRADQWLTETSSTDHHMKHPKASKKDVVELKEWHREELRKAKNEREIDEASTRDALYAMFFQLSRIMDNEENDTVWWEGSFEATAGQAFHLRGRVIRRLALFDLSDTALQEVRAKKGLVDY